MINQLRDKIHAANVEAGWWTNIQTGESILTTRNRPEMICLIGSELIEAHQDGFTPDSHLPQYHAFQVELADAAIRILDLAGADDIDLENDGGYGQHVTGQPLNDLMTVMTLTVGHALEGYRKSNTEKYSFAIASAFKTIENMADVYEFNLLEIIDAKAQYNANRADHKISNRLKQDGKKC